MQNLDELSRTISDEIHDALRQYENNRPRTQQRRLGPSALGGCRELIRATIAGDRIEPTTELNWPAFLGTAIGDAIETVLKDTFGAVTQRRVTTVLPSGIAVSGSSDLIFTEGAGRLCDLKAKSGLDTIISEGPSLENKIQVACYLVGLVQEGVLKETATASLIYVDRSGAQSHPYVVSMTYEQAVSWVEVADERLSDVQRALASGESQGYLRDKDESWCARFCGFHYQCWPGDDFNPPEEITDPLLVDALRRYDKGRELAKAAKQLQEEAKEDLGGYSEHPRSGHTDDMTVKWTLYEGRGGMVSQRIDARWVKGKQPAKPYVRINDVVKSDV